MKRVSVILGAILLAFMLVFISSQAMAADSDLVISEVLYNAVCTQSVCGGGPGNTEHLYEWVEIYNKGATPVTIVSGTWQVCDRQDCDPLAADVTINPGEYFILGSSILSINVELANYTTTTIIPAQFITVPTGLGNGLGNGGDGVYLLNSANEVTDCVSWHSESCATILANDGVTYTMGATGYDGAPDSQSNGRSILNNLGPTEAGDWCAQKEFTNGSETWAVSLYVPGFCDPSGPTAVQLSNVEIQKVEIIAIFFLGMFFLLAIETVILLRHRKASMLKLK